jgi:MFS family permease
MYFLKQLEECERAADTQPKVGFWRLVWIGIAAAKDYRILLSYVAAFIYKGQEYIVIGPLIFISQRAYAPTPEGKEQGIEQANYLTQIGMIVVVFGAILFGYLADKNVSSVKITNVSMLFSLIAMLGIAIFNDITSAYCLLWAALWGFGMAGLVVGQMHLVSKYSQEDHRGTTFGIQALFQYGGLLLATLLGGWLFDTWTTWAHAYLMSICTVALMTIWVIVYLVWGCNEAEPASQEPQAVPTQQELTQNSPETVSPMKEASISVV